MRNLLSFILMVSTLCGQTVVVKHRSGGGNSNGYTKGAVFTFNVHPASNLTAFANYFHSTYSQFADVAHGGYVTHTTTLLGKTVPADFIFTSDTAGATLCNGSAPCYGWEIEGWDNTTGEMWGWVATDRSSSADTLIYAWVGKASVTTYQCTASATWGTAYKYVWHMSDNAATPTVLDSTANGTNGTNSVNTSTKSAAGKMGQGLTYVNASSDYTSVTSGITLGSETDHISFWIKATQVAESQTVFSLGNNPADGGTGLFFQNYYNAGAPYWRDYNGNGYSASLGAVTSGVWVKVDILRSDTHDYLYINGSYVLDNNGSIAAYDHSNLYLGNGYPTSADAVIDELHVRTPWPSATKAADDDWIAHEYRQQNQASAWYTVGGWTP